MHYFDPARRKTSNGRPMFVDLPYPLPVLTTNPTTATSAAILAFLPMGYNDFAQRSVTIELSELESFFNSYYLDPEAWLASAFNWTPPDLTQAKAAAKAVAEARTATIQAVLDLI